MIPLRTHDLLPGATLVVLSLSVAVAPGCGATTTPPEGGTGGTVTSTGGTDASTGGADTSTGGAGTSTGGADASTGGADTSTGGADTSTGGTDASTGGAGTSTGGADTSTGGGSGGPDAVMPSTGCGETPPAAGPSTIDVDGLMREYILALPDGYDSEKPYRLIFTWHPWGGSAQQVAGNGPSGYYGLLGASEGAAILVSPEGLDFGGNGLGWGNEGGQDIDFLNAMMERFDSELCFDKNRVFSTGFSFGGMMSNAVACSGLARAIAPMAGNSQVSGCANGTQPVAYMGFHGNADSVVSISGGEAARDVFIERNGCGAAQPSESNWCELAGANYQPCECTTYQGCTEGYPVTWCEFSGNHMVAPNSAQTIWDFFAQF